jgi:catechol 2,3-dioxygenase-like lactoylglutathione lyase family enzyme
MSEDAKDSNMVRTYGLTHINLVVRDAERSLRFYAQVFGVEEYGRTEGLVHTRTPGCHDVITFDEHSPGAGESRGIAHFGFRLVSPADIDAAVAEVERAGGKLLRRGEFSPGYPYAYVHDPDGYEVEIWYE